MEMTAIQSALVRAGVSRTDIATAQQLSDTIETCHNCVNPLTPPRIVFDGNDFGDARIPAIVYLSRTDEYRIFVRNVAQAIAHTEDILLDGLGASVRRRRAGQHTLVLYAVSISEVRRRMQFHVANIQMFDPRSRARPDPSSSFAQHLAKTAITRRRRELLQAGHTRRARIAKEISDFDALVVQIMFTTRADWSHGGIHSSLLSHP